MKWPRIQGFEFNDHRRTPPALAETVIEALGRTLRWGRMLDGLTAPLAAYLEAAGTSDLLDLGAGAGDVAETLLGALERAGHPEVTITLTDLYPRVPQWERLVEARSDDRLRYVEASVDATALGEEVSQGRARVLINTLHHLPPEIARGVFQDAVARRAPLFVSEAFGRAPEQFLNFGPVGTLALLVNPLLTPRRRVEKALYTWLTPTALLVSIWDGVTSTLRVYDEEELRGFAHPSPGYTWVWGRYAYPPKGTGYYFYGVPSSR